MSEIDAIRAKLESFRPGLGRYAALLVNAGFSSEDQSDHTAIDLLSSLQVSPDDRRDLFKALRGRRGTFPPGLGWIEPVEATWPAPIAYEYRELSNAVAANRVEAVVWQLKDLAEVLVKLPALMLARDILTHGSKESRDQVRHDLFSRPLSFGTWLGFLRNLAPLSRIEGRRLLFPEIITLFFARPPATERLDQTKLYTAISRILEFRNDAFGHGAYRPDLDDFVADVVPLLSLLNSALAESVQQQAWRGIALAIGSPEGETLVGWHSIQKHRQDDNHPHGTVRTPLFLTKPESPPLALWPFIALRKCSRCFKRDVFLYDSRSEDREHFILLDYLAGHRLKRNPGEEEELAKEASDVRFEIVDDAALIDEDYGRTDLDDFLVRKASAARYLAPTYLHAPLSEFITAHRKGIFWLAAPGHVGKSVFVNGLTDHEFRAQAIKSAPWLDNAITWRFTIKREIRYTARELKNLIRRQVIESKDGFNRTARGRDLPELDLEAADPAGEFARFLHEVMVFKPAAVDRVVFFIDGLDELRQAAGERGIESFLPDPDALPDHLYLALTSRPLADCPAFVAAALNARQYGSRQLAQVLELRLDGDDAVARGYRDLLRRYYDRETDLARKKAIEGAIRKLLEAGGKLSLDFSRIADQPTRDRAQSIWKSFSTELQSAAQGSGEAISLAARIDATVRPFKAAFDVIVRKAGAQFAFVAFLTGQIARGLIDPDTVGNLPAEDHDSLQWGKESAPGPSRLYQNYLAALEKQLTGGTESTKHWDYVRRILVVLAADEEAHQCEAFLVREVYPHHPYQGMSISDIANRLGEPGVTYRLVSAIYSFQTLLAAWRQDGAKTPRYGLGLKDLVATLRALYFDEIVAEHREVVKESPVDEILAGAARLVSAERADALLKAVTHEQWLAWQFDTEVEEPVSVVAALIKACAAQHEQNQHRAAVVLGVLALMLMDRIGGREGPEWIRYRIGDLVRANYLQSYAVAVRHEDALAVARNFAAELANGDDSHWDDLIICAEQYCTFAEELGARPAALISLIEQREFDRLFSTINAQPEVQRGILLMGIAPQLLDAGEPELGFQAWQQGADLAATPLNEGIAHEVACSQAAKLVTAALSGQMHRFYQDYTSGREADAAAVEIATQAQGVPSPTSLPGEPAVSGNMSPIIRYPAVACRKVPGWARFLARVHNDTLGTWLFFGSLCLFIGCALLGSVATEFGYLPKKLPDWLWYFFMMLLGLFFASMFSSVPLGIIARRLRRHWAERVHVLPAQLDRGISELQDPERTRLREEAIRLVAGVFKDDPGWQAFLPSWIEQQLSPLLQTPKRAAQWLSRSAGYGDIAAAAIAAELLRADNATVEAICQETRSSLPVLKVTVQVLDRSRTLGWFVSLVAKFSGTSSEDGKPSQEQLAIATLAQAPPAALGRALIWAAERKDVRASTSGWLGRSVTFVTGLFAEVKQRPLLAIIKYALLVAGAAFLGAVGLVITMIPLGFLPQILIIVLAARLHDPHHLALSVRGMRAAQCREAIAKILWRGDDWILTPRAFRYLLRDPIRVVMSSLFRPIAMARIREAVLTQMLLTGEMDASFQSSFSIESMRRIVSRILKSRLAGKRAVLYCMGDRKLLEVAKAEKLQILGSTGAELPNEEIRDEELDRLLPLAPTLANFLLLLALAIAANLAWWWLLRVMFPQGNLLWFLSFSYGGQLVIAISTGMLSADYLHAILCRDDVLPAFLTRRYPPLRRARWHQLGWGIAFTITTGIWIIPGIHASAEKAGFAVPAVDLWFIDWWFVAVPVFINSLVLPILVSRWRGAGFFSPSHQQWWRQPAIVSGLFIVLLPLTSLATYAIIQGLVIWPGLDHAARAAYTAANQSEAKGEYPEYIRQLSLIIGMEPNNTEARVRRCRAYQVSGDRDRAVADCTDAIHLDPGRADAFFNRALIYQANGEFEQAIADFAKAVERAPSNGWNHWGYGWALRSANRTRDAMAEFATAVNLAPKNAYFVIWLHLIRAQMGEDDRRELEANAENLDRAKWPWPVVAFQLGTMSPERLEALAASADDAVKRNEQQCEATYYLGAHHAAADRKDEARRLFRLALEICPRNFFEFSAANLELKRLE